MKTLAGLIAFTLTIGAYANDLKNVVLQDGSVARCQRPEDDGNRVYRLTATKLDENTIELRVDSLICTQSKSGVALSAQELCQTERIAQKSGAVLENIYSQPALQITNNEGTKEFARLALNSKAESQTVVLKLDQLKNKTSAKSVDVTLQMLKTVIVNGQFLDERVVSGGHYRLSF